MFKKFFIRKNKIQNVNGQVRKDNIDSNIFLKNKDKFKFENLEELFEKTKNLEVEKNKVYLENHNDIFNNLMINKNYVDYKYIALQLYLSQNSKFKFQDIENALAIVIKFIEDNLKDGKAISFGDFFLKIRDDRKFEGKGVLELKKNIVDSEVYQVKDIKIELEGLNEYAIYEFVLKNFEKIFEELLEYGHNVLIGNFVLMKLENEFRVFVSQKFYSLVDESRHDVTLTFELLVNKNKANDEFDIMKDRGHGEIYKTQIISINDANNNNEENQFIESNNIEEQSIYEAEKNKYNINDDSEEETNDDLDDDLILIQENLAKKVNQKEIVNDNQVYKEVENNHQIVKPKKTEVKNIKNTKIIKEVKYKSPDDGIMKQELEEIINLMDTLSMDTSNIRKERALKKISSKSLKKVVVNNTRKKPIKTSTKKKVVKKKKPSSKTAKKTSVVKKKPSSKTAKKTSVVKKKPSSKTTKKTSVVKKKPSSKKSAKQKKH